MVFFTCSHCGESIKKAAVSKHYQTKCKNNTPFVTCVDCLKDFKGSDYDAHIKCFTEEEKYSAKGFVPKASANKGERKQKAWSECVQAFASNGDLQEDEKNLLETISKHDNIPRKKAKFINFLNSTARSFINKTELVDRVWTKLENYFKEVNSESQKNAETNDMSGKKGEGNTQSEKKKRKQDEMTEGDDKNEDGQKGKKKKKHFGEEPEKAENGGVTGENKGKKKKKRPSGGEDANENDQPKNKKAKKAKENGVGNDSNDKENVSQKKKKDGEKEASTEEDTAEDENEADDTFDWNDAIMKIVTQNGAKNQMKVNKLQKKVLKIYGETKGCEINEKLAKKFSKKLNKIDSITLNGDYVSLKA